MLARDGKGRSSDGVAARKVNAKRSAHAAGDHVGRSYMWEAGGDVEAFADTCYAPLNGRGRPSIMHC